MTRSVFTQGLLRMALVAAIVALPLASPDGQLWVMMIAAGVTVYSGARSSSVYSMAAVIAATELLFGIHVGVAVSSYLSVVLLYLVVRRFLAVPTWSTRDGWRLADVAANILVALLFYTATVAVGVLIGDMYYGFGAVAHRLLLFVSADHLLVAAVVCAATIVVHRRMQIPFHREILFGV